MDIGAHHPFFLSNTAIFYERGCRGICIEPDPILFKEIKKHRKNDICLNIGIGTGEKKLADFYVMSSQTLNTFSKHQVEEYKKNSTVTIKDILKVPLISVDEIINKYCSNTPNFISLDVEGLDFLILESFNFIQFRPEVICLETLSYTENNKEKKLTKIPELMISNGYMQYADTYINSVFIDEKIWVNRKR